MRRLTMTRVQMDFGAMHSSRRICGNVLVRRRETYLPHLCVLYQCNTTYSSFIKYYYRRAEYCSTFPSVPTTHFRYPDTGPIVYPSPESFPIHQMNLLFKMLGGSSILLIHPAALILELSPAHSIPIWAECSAQLINMSSPI
jgi:hypothetical protein